MYKIAGLIIVAVLLFMACNKEEPTTPNNEIPVVKTESSCSFLVVTKLAESPFPLT